MGNRKIIKTSGRTGSHLLLSDYEQMGYTKKYTTDKKLFWEMEGAWAKGLDYVVQDHLLAHPADVSAWDLIYSYREDMASQVISSFIAKSTGVWRNESGQHIPTDKLSMSDEDIKSEAMIHLVFKEYMIKSATMNWASVEVISMEKLLENNYEHKSKWISIAHSDAINNIDEHRRRVQACLDENLELAKAYAIVKYDQTHGDGTYV
jgi:hypothetical protein|tara:strand:+ start:8652 stop:9269 length:618 start_codon:yes stop_codon:yes gene_type:complete